MDGRISSDVVGHDKQPLIRVSAGQELFVLVVAGEGFEPSKLSRRIYSRTATRACDLRLHRDPRNLATNEPQTLDATGDRRTHPDTQTTWRIGHRHLTGTRGSATRSLLSTVQPRSVLVRASRRATRPPILRLPRPRTRCGPRPLSRTRQRSSDRARRLHVLRHLTQPATQAAGRAESRIFGDTLWSCARHERVTPFAQRDAWIQQRSARSGTPRCPDRRNVRLRMWRARKPTGVSLLKLKERGISCPIPGANNVGPPAIYPAHSQAVATYTLVAMSKPEVDERISSANSRTRDFSPNPPGTCEFAKF